MNPKNRIPECAKANACRTTAMNALLAGMVLVMPQVLAAEAGYRRLPVAEYRDKMKGAWLGQMIGVGWGDTTEGKFNFKIIPEDKMPPWKPKMVNQYMNDDCRVLGQDFRRNKVRGIVDCL